MDADVHDGRILTSASIFCACTRARVFHVLDQDWRRGIVLERKRLRVWFERDLRRKRHLALALAPAIQPKLDLIGQALTRDLAGRYGPDAAVSFPDCSPRNLDQRRKDDELDARLGLRTFNEIRKARGLDPFPDPRFDKPILPKELDS